MTEIATLLQRIADALDRIAPPPAAFADPASAWALRWDGSRLAALSAAAVVPLDRFVGVDAQMQALIRNFEAHSDGRPAHDCLLWGARGSGKSALVRSVAQATGLAIVEAAADGLGSLPALFAMLEPVPRPFLLFVDDLAFEADDPAIRSLRSLLDGGVAARPSNVRFAMTSNHRHLLAREAGDSASRHARDALDDQLALVDRFGLVLGFHVPSQDEYLDMVRRHCSAEELVVDPADALAFALSRGGRSGRTAWHYRTELLTRR